MQACRKRKLIELTDANRNPSPPFICLFSVCFYPDENRNSVRRESKLWYKRIEKFESRLTNKYRPKSPISFCFYYQKWWWIHAWCIDEDLFDIWESACFHPSIVWLFSNSISNSIIFYFYSISEKHMDSPPLINPFFGAHILHPH